MPYKPLGINLNREYRNDLNGMLKELYDRVSNIVAQAGSDNTEIVDARLGVDGQARPTLGDFIRELQQQIIALQENGGNQEEIDQLNTRITAVENALAGKANVEDLNNVISALNTKANQSDLTNLQNTVTSHLAEITQQQNIIVTVGNGGDFATINDALEYLTKKHARYFKNNYTAEIKLLSGFVLEEQIFVKGINLGWITINSEDSEVSIRRSALTKESPVYFNGLRIPVFLAYQNAVLPVIDTLFNMDTSGNHDRRDGIVVANNSRAAIKSGCGIKNVCPDGGDNSSLLVLYGSIVDADYSIFTGGKHAIHAEHSSFINARGVDASNSMQDAIHANRGCVINAENAIATNAYSTGIYAARGSIINAEYANVSGAGSIGIYARFNSFINAYGANARIGASDSNMDINVKTGSIINAHNATGGLSQTANAVTTDGVIFR